MSTRYLEPFNLLQSFHGIDVKSSLSWAISWPCIQLELLELQDIFSRPPPHDRDMLLNYRRAHRAKRKRYSFYIEYPRGSSGIFRWSSAGCPCIAPTPTNVYSLCILFCLTIICFVFSHDLWIVLVVIPLSLGVMDSVSTVLLSFVLSGFDPCMCVSWVLL